MRFPFFAFSTHPSLSKQFVSFILSEKASHYSIFHSFFLPFSILHEDPKAEDCDLYRFEVFVLSPSSTLSLSPSSTLDSLRENIRTTTTVKRIHQHECSHKYHSHSTQVNDHIPAQIRQTVFLDSFFMFITFEGPFLLTSPRKRFLANCLLFLSMKLSKSLKVEVSESETSLDSPFHTFPVKLQVFCAVSFRHSVQNTVGIERREGEGIKKVLCSYLALNEEKYWKILRRNESAWKKMRRRKKVSLRFFLPSKSNPLFISLSPSNLLISSSHISYFSFFLLVSHPFLCVESNLT